MCTTSRLINLSICTVFTCHTHLQTVGLGHLVLWFFLALGDHRWTISNGLVYLLVKLQYTLPQVMCFPPSIDVSDSSILIIPHTRLTTFAFLSLYLMFSSLSILQQVPTRSPLIIILALLSLSHRVSACSPAIAISVSRLPLLQMILTSSSFAFVHLFLLSTLSISYHVRYFGPYT